MSKLYGGVLTDQDVADLLGLDIKGHGLQNLSAMTEVDRRGKDFAAALEDRLQQAKVNVEVDEVLEIALGASNYAAKVMSERIVGNIKNIRETVICSDVNPINRIMEADRSAEIIMQVDIYTGTWTGGRTKVSNHRRIRYDVLGRIDKVPVDLEGHGTVEFVRTDKPVSDSVSGPVKVETGIIHPTHHIHTSYSATLSREELYALRNKSA